MLYRLAHFIQEKCPWLWEVVEDLNAAVCGLKIGNSDRLQECLMIDVRIAGINDAERLADFFARQPEESFKWFRPHAFDETTLRAAAEKAVYELKNTPSMQDIVEAIQAEPVSGETEETDSAESESNTAE